MTDWHQGKFNQITKDKKQYIKMMRFAICERDIIDAKSGALNLKYFNNKKGSYWSDRETLLLQKLLLIVSPLDLSKIKAFEKAANQIDPFGEQE